MKKAPVGLMFIALAAALSGCFQHTYDIGTGAPEAPVVYKHWHHHWLFGLIRPKLQEKVALGKFCPSGEATIHEEVSFVNGLVNVLIGIIYSPTTVTIQCEDGSQAEVELTADEMVAMTRNPRFLDVVQELAPERLDESRVALLNQQGTAVGMQFSTAP